MGFDIIEVNIARNYYGTMDRYLKVAGYRKQIKYIKAKNLRIKDSKKTEFFEKKIEKNLNKLKNNIPI